MAAVCRHAFVHLSLVVAVGPNDRFKIGHLVAPHRGLRLVSTTVTVHASSINYSLVDAVGPNDRFKIGHLVAPPRGAVRTLVQASRQAKSLYKARQASRKQPTLPASFFSDANRLLV
jgi:hypothetical protein